MSGETLSRCGWAVTGTGTVAAEQMVAAIRAFGHTPLWVTSRSEVRASHFARDTNIPNSTTDVRQAMRDAQVDFVYIAAPLIRRPFYIRAVAEAGKHILCDGPVAKDAKTAAALVQTCQDAGTYLAVNQRGRTAAVHQAMRRLIADGEIGVVHSISIFRGGPHYPVAMRWHEAGENDPNIFLDMCAEDIDLARFLSGAEPVEAAGLASPVGGAPSDLAYSLRMGDVLFQAHESYATSDIESRIIAAGSEGSLVASGTLGPRGSGTLMRRHHSRNEFLPIRERDHFAAVLELFLEAVDGGPPTLATGTDSLASLTAAEAVMKAVRKGRTVAIPC